MRTWNRPNLFHVALSWRFVGAALLLVLMPRALQAQVPCGTPRSTSEATLSAGLSVGGDVGDFSFDRAAIGGGRFGGFFISERCDGIGQGWGVEGSALYSRGPIAGDPETPNAIDASVLYVEASLLWILTRGAVQPFLAGGVGVHRLEVDLGPSSAADTTLGWSWGGGVKATRGRLVLRGDVRRHATRLDSGSALTFPDAQDVLRRWELSVSIGLVF